MTSLTYLQAFTGGALIGLAAALFLLLDGRIAGVSGIIGANRRGTHRGYDFWLRPFPFGHARSGPGARLSRCCREFRPSLAFVLAGAVMVSTLGTLISRRLRRPLLDSKFHLPVKHDIDVPLVAGAAIFGAGWGMSGLCPGPAIASLALGFLPSYVFAGTMLAGILLHDHWPQWLWRAGRKHRDA